MFCFNISFGIFFPLVWSINLYFLPDWWTSLKSCEEGVSPQFCTPNARLLCFALTLKLMLFSDAASLLSKCPITGCTVKILYCNNPDTHFAKWSHYLTAHALIGHLISLALTMQRPRFQVNRAWSWCEAVGRQSQQVRVEGRRGGQWSGCCAATLD